MNLLFTYEKFSHAYKGKPALEAFRRSAYEFAMAKGLPTRNDEEWHYTSLKVLDQVSFMPSAFNPIQPSHETLKEIKTHLNSDFTNVVFFNGVLNKTLSDELPVGLTIGDFSKFPQNFDDTFDAINSAYQVDPMVFKVDQNTSVEKPVHFLFFTSVESGPALMVHPKIFVEVGSRSAVSIIESYFGVAGVSYFVNSVLDLQLCESAKATHIRVQSESLNAINIGRTRFVLAANAHLQSVAVATGAGLSRHNLDLAFRGKGAHADVLGVYAVSGSQHVDNTTSINHIVGECSSDQLYKGILDGDAKGVFCGKVLIQKDAQKAQSSQLNNNLLLSSKAEADSKPCLEIYADDVKASHGSTVGQLDQEELFYLQSRAIDKEQALTLLSYGFLSEVIYKIENEKLIAWLTKILDSTFTRFGKLR